MKIVDSGVATPSFMEFAIPSTFARETLYYITQYGHFFCDGRYQVERESLDQFLFVYVRTGTLWVRTKGREAGASAGNVILLDCREEHAYYCKDQTEFLWFHFQGDNIEKYSEYLYEKYGFCVMDTISPEQVGKYFDRIFAYMQFGDTNEHMISLYIGKCLAYLAAAEESREVGDIFRSVLIHIREHFGEELSLDDLADVCGLSKSYFIRKFKNKIGSTPHDYLLFYRLRQAKQELRSTDDSMEEIADRCGFNSASHFARAFKKENDMTPSEFRQMKF